MSLSCLADKHVFDVQIKFIFVKSVGLKTILFGLNFRLEM